jgi:hypothetical protein
MDSRLRGNDTCLDFNQNDYKLFLGWDGLQFDKVFNAHIVDLP